jgi:hypothetical protein
MRISIEKSRHRLQSPRRDPVIVTLQHGYVPAPARGKTSLIITTDSQVRLGWKHAEPRISLFVFFEDAKCRIIRTIVYRYDFEIEIRALHEDAIKRLGDVLCVIVSDEQYAQGGVGCVGHWPES